MVVCSEYDSDARVRRQAEALASRGDQVTVFALHAQGRPKMEIVDGVRVVRARTRKYRGDSTRAYMSLYLGFGVRATLWLLRRLRSFDLVQVHSIPEVLVFAATAHAASRVPVLLDIHDLSEQLFASKFRKRGAFMTAIRLSTRASLWLADEVLTVHDEYAQTIRSMTKRPVNVMVNAPDDRIFKPRPFRPWDPNGEVVFGYHGLIAPRHGLVNVVEALKRLRDDVDARLLLFGGGDGLPAVRQRVAELGLQDVVRLPDAPLPVTEVVKEIEPVHIGLVPSLRDPWTDHVLPTKLLEYATLGIPVITFRNPVIERYFPPDAVTFVDPATPENLYTAMRMLASDPERGRKQAERAAEIMADICWPAQRQAYLDLIDRMVGRRPRIARQRRAEDRGDAPTRAATALVDTGQPGHE